jgi:hypothetical protein
MRTLWIRRHARLGRWLAALLFIAFAGCGPGSDGQNAAGLPGSTAGSTSISGTGGSSGGGAAASGGAVAGAAMTRAAGDATSIAVPATAGTYRLFVVDSQGTTLGESAALLRVSG